MHRVPAALAVLALASLSHGGELAPEDVAAPARGRETTSAAAVAARLRSELARRPHAAAVWVELGHVERRRCALSPAMTAYRRALEHDPHDPEARAGLGELLLLGREPGEALAHAELGLATARGRRCARLWRVKALALLEQSRVPEARRAAARGVALDPQDPRVLEALARAEYRAGDIGASRAAYRGAAALDPLAEEANLRLGSGFGPPVEGAPWREARLRPLWQRALAAWDAGELGEAIARFHHLCQLGPEVYKFRLGLGLARRTLRRAEEARFGPGAVAAFLRLPAPEPEGLGAVVPGYGELDPVARHAVRVALAPAAPWLAALEAAGATHEVLSLDDGIADVPHRRPLRGRRCFDGRDYEHLRGVGGRRAATGVEKLHEAAAFGFHTFAHEFAHQLLEYAFSEPLRREVEELYDAALAAGACLDWYAASNAHEYFAQGYEAFVSHAKRGCLKETQRHTRDELAGRDPDLHAFLAAHLDLGHETEASMAAFRASLP